jgi:hypothetical protein
VKYVILIHSNPDPWGHPTIDFTEEGRAIPKAEREASERLAAEAAVAAEAERQAAAAADAERQAEARRPTDTAEQRAIDEAAITDDSSILAASQVAELDEQEDLDAAARQRIYLLNKVRLKLSDYE